MLVLALHTYSIKTNILCFFLKRQLENLTFFLATDGAAITNSFQSVLFHENRKFLQGLVGFGNLCFAEIKSCPSASPTPQSGDFNQY